MAYTDYRSFENRGGRGQSAVPTVKRNRSTPSRGVVYESARRNPTLNAVDPAVVGPPENSGMSPGIQIAVNAVIGAIVVVAVGIGAWTVDRLAGQVDTVVASERAASDAVQDLRLDLTEALGQTNSKLDVLIERVGNLTPTSQPQ